MAPRVLVFGTGSIGTVYLWVLSKSIPATNVTAICRSNYEQATQHGFVVHSTLWGNDLRTKPVIARTVEEAVQKTVPEESPFDYIVVCCKAIPTTPSTAEIIRSAVSKTTAIVLIQNGIGIEDEFATAFPDNPIISTVVYLPATQVSPGVVHHKEIELLHVGTYPASAPPSAKAAAEAFVDLLTASGATVRLHDDIQPERWSKLTVNAAWNPICALARCRDRQFMDAHEEATVFVRDVMLEVARIAQAYGHAQINEELVERQIGRAKARDLPGVQPSMLSDALVGRNLEVEAIVGNAVRLARRKNVETPLLRTIYMLASGLDRSFALSKPS